jgi:nucleoside-diphosphate-sugar epimerase
VRVLLVGGGCRGLALTRELVAEGHAVRAVTRSEANRARIEAAGAECWIGDPDVVGTLRYALDNVTLLVWALATVDAPSLHGSRLAMMLEKTVDTTVRGVVYEAGADHPAGREEPARARAANEIRYELLEADPADERAWVAAARGAIDALLAPRT